MRDTQLDGLRGLAAMGIVFFHAHYTSSLDWMRFFVDLFFVLSGFVITRLIIQGLQSGHFSLRNFMIRRVLRVWPVYYAMLLFCCAVVVAKYAMTGQWKNIDGMLTAPFFLQYTHHYLSPHFNAGPEDFILWFHHSWSIALEEQFYLLAPLLLMALRKRLIWVGALAAALIPLAVFFRFDGAFQWLLVARMDALCIGMLIALYWTGSRARGVRWSRAAVISVGILGLVLIFAYPIGMPISSSMALAIRLLGFNLIFGVVLLALVDDWSPRLNSALSSRPMIFLGSISYALYLMHIPVRGALLFVAGGEEIAEANVGVQITYFALSILVAYLSRRWIESRVERFKHAFPVSTFPQI